MKKIYDAPAVELQKIFALDVIAASSIVSYEIEGEGDVLSLSDGAAW